MSSPKNPWFMLTMGQKAAPRPMNWQGWVFLLFFPASIAIDLSYVHNPLAALLLFIGVVAFFVVVVIKKGTSSTNKRK